MNKRLLSSLIPLKVFSRRTFIHEFGGSETINVSLALLCQLSLPRLSQPCYAHLQTTEGARATVLLTSRGQDLSSHTVQRLTIYHTEVIYKRRESLVELHINLFSLYDTTRLDDSITATINLLSGKKKEGCESRSGLTVTLSSWNW